MSEMVESRGLARGRLAAFLLDRRGMVRDYFAALGGTAGRLVFSLAYFVLLANTLTIGEFGIFATASAAGVVLSRILGFGFISTLYRVAAVRPRLIGTFAAGFVVMGVLSLPALALASGAMYAAFFAETIAVHTFASVIIAETLLWRPVEAVIIVNNGTGRFARAAVLTILGTALRAGFALAFMLDSERTLERWTLYYLAANAMALGIALAWFRPSGRLRMRLRLYWKRLPDALYVAGAEILFYLQMEFDKFLVLSMGGARFAGIYAIVMRLVDLTAIPVRAFSMMLVQTIMRRPDLLKTVRIRGAVEILIFLASTAGMVVIAAALRLQPTIMGQNVAQAAGLLGLALLVPGLRNLAEYQAELLFARGQTATRALNLALLGAAKALMLTALLSQSVDIPALVLNLNLVFAALYGISAVLTYTAMRMPARTI